MVPQGYGVEDHLDRDIYQEHMEEQRKKDKNRVVRNNAIGSALAGGAIGAGLGVALGHKGQKAWQQSGIDVPWVKTKSGLTGGAVGAATGTAAGIAGLANATHQEKKRQEKTAGVNMQKIAAFSAGVDYVLYNKNIEPMLKLANLTEVEKRKLQDMRARDYQSMNDVDRRYFNEFKENEKKWNRKETWERVLGGAGTGALAGAGFGAIRGAAKPLQVPDNQPNAADRLPGSVQKGMAGVDTMTGAGSPDQPQTPQEQPSNTPNRWGNALKGAAGWGAAGLAAGAAGGLLADRIAKKKRQDKIDEYSYTKALKGGSPYRPAYDSAMRRIKTASDSSMSLTRRIEEEFGFVKNAYANLGKFMKSIRETSQNAGKSMQQMGKAKGKYKGFHSDLGKGYLSKSLKSQASGAKEIGGYDKLNKVYNSNKMTGKTTQIAEGRDLRKAQIDLETAKKTNKNPYNKKLDYDYALTR